jgi:hypothetical protein
MADVGGDRPSFLFGEAIAMAAACFGISKADLIGRSPERRLAYPRMLAMAALRGLTKPDGKRPMFSFPRIARAFGRDHTTAMYATWRADEILSEATWLREPEARLRQYLRAPRSFKAERDAATMVGVFVRGRFTVIHELDVSAMERRCIADFNRCRPIPPS